MTDGIQHALIGALVALTALLEARRRRELRRDLEERAERLAAAARRAHVDPVDSSPESSSGNDGGVRPKDS